MAEKKIGKNVYKCDPLTGREPWALLLEIKSLLVPLGSVFGGSDATKETALAAELFAAMGSINDDAVLDMMDKLIKMCRVDGDPAVWGMKPASMDEAMQVVAWVLEIQFADFFAGSALKGLGANLAKLH